MASLPFTKSAIPRGKDEVYVVAVPLRATKGPAQVLMSAAYSLNIWDLQHFMVLIKPSSPPPYCQGGIDPEDDFWVSVQDSSIRFFMESEIFCVRNGNGDLEKALVFDFQPKDPENLYVALDVISGRAVPGEEHVVTMRPEAWFGPIGHVVYTTPKLGVLLMRELRKVPRSKCWYVGSPEVDAVDIACEFNKSWETDLRVGRHDCRDYTNGLIEYLTGQKDVLEHLRRSTGGQG